MTEIEDCEFNARLYANTHSRVQMKWSNSYVRCTFFRSSAQTEICSACVCVQIHTYWITIYRSTSVSLIFGLHILILDMQYNIRNAFHVLDINIPLIESIQLSSFCVLKSGAKAAERKRKGKSMASIGRLHSLCIYFPVNVVVLFKMYWMRT